MKAINANTKIAFLLKENPAALDAIISISPRFNKLQNPLLRKLMAGRTSIKMASKVGGCTVDDFFKKLEPLGFIIDNQTVADDGSDQNRIPEFVHKTKAGDVVDLDVRTEIESGNDPLNHILKAIKQLPSGQVLKLINSFEPVPLMLLLEKQGFESYSDPVGDNLVYTYFHKKQDDQLQDVDISNAGEGWDEMMEKFKEKMVTVDVRHLEMPLPMLTILEALENLPNEKALYVIHKRIPLFLLPELADRKFDYRIKEVADGEVHLIIFKA